MIYQCIRCRELWENGKPDDGGLYSHGLCVACLRDALIPIYRKRQKREGVFDCFGRSNGFCDQELCKYRKLCIGS